MLTQECTWIMIVVSVGSGYVGVIWEVYRRFGGRVSSCRQSMECAVLTPKILDVDKKRQKKRTRSDSSRSLM